MDGATVTGLTGACAELATWLPHAAVLTTQPTTDGTTTRSKPGTKPPGNWAVIALIADIAEGVRRAEDQLRAELGLPVRRWRKHDPGWTPLDEGTAP
jgi:hypothetical protein